MKQRREKQCEKNRHFMSLNIDKAVPLQHVTAPTNSWGKRCHDRGQHTAYPPVTSRAQQAGIRTDYITITPVLADSCMLYFFKMLHLQGMNLKLPLTDANLKDRRATITKTYIDHVLKGTGWMFTNAILKVVLSPFENIHNGWHVL